jgi:putative NADH-flavin reductase
MSSQTPSEDGETTSAAETVKNLIKKNKTKILVVGGAVLAVVTGVVISLAEGQDVTEEAEDFEDSERFPEPPVAEAQKRHPPPGTR